MSSIVISGDTSGAVTLTVPATAGTNTVTIPASTGTVMVSSNMPAFSAYQSGSAQVVSASAWTKITINTKEFDTNTNFDNVTNYRFTPTVAGYYQISATIQYAGDATTGASIYKNGSIFKVGHFSSSGAGRASTVSALINFNGSTDYVEFYGYCNVTGTVATGASSTWFQGVMVRAA